MVVNQISVFLENKAGRLVSVTEVLTKNKINIRALSLADTSDFGILRLIVDDSQKAYTVLKDVGFTVNVTDVIALKMPDEPGGLNGVLQFMKDQGISIEYMYAFLGTEARDAMVIFRVDDSEKALKLIEKSGIDSQ